SNDRKQFGQTYSLFRPWEYNADTDQDGFGEFPPVFVSQFVGGMSTNPATFTNTLGEARFAEPFRGALRDLLTVERNDANTVQKPWHPRLNVNRLLVGTDPTTFKPIYRELTPHPEASLTAAALPSHVLPPSMTPIANPYPPTNAVEQEFWARYDRQLMARD